MNKILKNKLEEKFKEILTQKKEIEKIMNSISDLDAPKSFILGIVVGRLYNSFYYQSKRNLNREPSRKDFDDFIEFVNKRKHSLENLW